MPASFEESGAVLPSAAIALGSNLGDRRAHIERALESLREVLDGVRVSAFLETEPVDVGPQPKFLNAVAVGRATLPPRELLARLLAIERSQGRVRPGPGAARTLDLDLVLYGQDVIDEPGIVVPHPRFRRREFVLVPLAEVAPEMIDPVTGLTARELLEALKR
jgi:2-amino-4-hydroxy-6-hydroxymethyldihydropteridine diphosphokinase